MTGRHAAVAALLATGAIAAVVNGADAGRRGGLELVHADAGTMGALAAGASQREDLAVGQIGGRRYAFVGVEGIGGVAVYDLSRPERPRFVQHLDTGGPSDGEPERLVFVPGHRSPVGSPLLVVSGADGDERIFAVARR